LKIIGGGELKEKLIKLANNLGIAEDTYFTGFIPEYSKMIEEMASSTVFVFPSTIEGFGIALIEAMAAGLPVIAYDLPAYKEFADNGKNAILVKPRDIAQLASEVINVLTDEKLYKFLALNGSKTASNFDWSIITEKVLKLYKAALVS